MKFKNGAIQPKMPFLHLPVHSTWVLSGLDDAPHDPHTHPNPINTQTLERTSFLTLLIQMVISFRNNLTGTLRNVTADGESLRQVKLTYEIKNHIVHTLLNVWIVSIFWLLGGRLLYIYIYIHLYK
jgi:hypothetical protein